jgi:hypothetical protein
MKHRASQGASVAPGVLTLRPGRGANCSSVGSVVDMLFLGGALGGALVVAVTAALESAMAAREAGQGPTEARTSYPESEPGTPAESDDAGTR